MPLFKVKWDGMGFTSRKSMMVKEDTDWAYDLRGTFEVLDVDPLALGSPGGEG